MKLAEQIVRTIMGNHDCINDTVDHLSSLGVTTDSRDVVDGGVGKFDAFRAEVVEQLMEEYDMGIGAAREKVSSFLIDCGYRKRALRKPVKGKKSTPFAKLRDSILDKRKKLTKEEKAALRKLLK
jgi:hypothetical protein